MKNLKEKQNQISALFSTQTPSDDWPDVVDRLTIGLVYNKYTKLGKIVEKLLLILGVDLYKNLTVLEQVSGC